MSIEQSIENPIDWNMVDTKLSVKKKKSIGFLKDNLL